MRTMIGIKGIKRKGLYSVLVLLIFIELSIYCLDITHQFIEGNKLSYESESRNIIQLAT